jgi:hypothetical protein
MYSLLALTLLAQAPEVLAASGSSPPEQVLAKIDGKGNLVITSVTCACYGPAQQEHTVTVGDPKAKVPVKVKTASVIVTTAELPARHVEAYSVDGKTISAETLTTLLAKEKTVLVAMDGKKVDPFYLQLYKEGTIILVPPANTLQLGGMGGYVGGYSGPVVAPQPFPREEAIPLPLPPQPPIEKKPQP